MFYSTHSSYFILNTHILLDSFTHKKNVFWFICIHTDYFYSFNISHLKLSNLHKKKLHTIYCKKKSIQTYHCKKKFALYYFRFFLHIKNHIHSFSHTILFIMFPIHTIEKMLSHFLAHTFLKYNTLSR